MEEIYLFMKKYSKIIIPTNNLRGYLTHLNKTPLLTLEEEVSLLTQISIHRERLFSRCSHFPFFRHEIVTLLDRKLRKDKDGIPIQAGLKPYPASIDTFMKRLTKVKKNMLSKYWEDAFIELKLTGNFATSLLSILETKYKFFIRGEELDTLRIFFKVPHINNLFLLAEDSLKNPRLRFQLEGFLNKNTSQILVKLLEVSSHKEDSLKLRHLRVGLGDGVQLKEIHRFIGCFEEDIYLLKKEVIDKNLRLVVSRAKYFIGRGFDFESIVQEGNLGLIKAVDKYCPKHGVKLGTYATWWIDQTIQRAIANKSKIIRIPTHIQTLQATLKDGILALTEKLNREPSDELLAKTLNLKEETIQMLRNIAQHRLELEIELEDGTLIQQNTSIEDDALNPLHITSQNIMREKVNSVISLLEPKYEMIIRLKYGIGLSESQFFEKLNKSNALMEKSNVEC